MHAIHWAKHYSSRVSDLILYQRDDCHLCDLALAVLAAARVSDFESVFIDGDPLLERHFGERVPVLSSLTMASELAWPFDVEMTQAFVSGR
jgi:hypothetical protein